MIGLGSLALSLEIVTTSDRHPEMYEAVTPDIATNIEALARAIDRVFVSFGDKRTVTGGLRTVESNAAMIAAGKKAAKRSNHIHGNAVDLEDNDGRLAKWCHANLDLLAHFELWMEDPRYTREKRKDGSWAQWVHLQRVPPNSGRRVFIPYKGAPPS